MRCRRLPIGWFLRKSDDWVQPALAQSYKQITVRLWGKGLKLRGEVVGANIAASRQLRVSSGQFVISRIDARHGAFGLVPDELHGALVSNDFPCFNIDDAIVLPRYLEWYSKTPEFVALCRRVSEGTTNRVRLREDDFLRMEVPVPPLQQQSQIVAQLDNTARVLDKQRQAVEAIELESELLLAKAFDRAMDGARYRPMAEVAPLVRRSVEVEPERKYTEIGVRSFYNGIFHRRTMPGAEFTWQELFWIKEGDLVFSNLMAWEQAIAVAKAEDDGAVGNHRMLTCEVNRKLALPSFLMAYFRTAEGFARVVGHSPGTIARNKTLSSKMLPTIEVPIPTLDFQSWFERLQVSVDQIRAIRAAAALDADGLIPALLHRIFKGSSKNDGSSQIISVVSVSEQKTPQRRVV